jgi:hypothetical protein
MAGRCPDGGDAVSATGKGLRRPSGSGLHTPAYGDATGVLRRGSDQARSTAGDTAPARGPATAGGRSERCRVGPSQRLDPVTLASYREDIRHLLAGGTRR